MRRNITLMLEPTERQVSLLQETDRLFTEVFNIICKGGWEHSDKNGVHLHHEFYYPLREKYPNLPSDLHIQARMRATEAIQKGLTLKKKGARTSLPQSAFCPPRYTANTYKIDWEARVVRISSVEGRQTIRFRISPHAEKFIQYQIHTAELIPLRGSWTLHVTVSTTAPQISHKSDVVGADLGLAQPAVTSNNLFLGKKSWKDRENRIFKLKRALQSRGTKSAKRHLKKICKTQARFRRDCDHVLSKKIVQAVPAGGTIVLENLTGIQKSVKRRKKTKEKRNLHSWSFAQIRRFIEYKAEERGCMVVGIDPRHTSQQCSRCGHTAKNNRRSRAVFRCRACGFTLHADLNAARNIAAKYRAQVGMPDLGGQPVNLPIVGVDELVHSATCKPPDSSGCC